MWWTLTWGGGALRARQVCGYRTTHGCLLLPGLVQHVQRWLPGSGYTLCRRWAKGNSTHFKDKVAPWHTEDPLQSPGTSPLPVHKQCLCLLPDEPNSHKHPSALNPDLSLNIGTGPSQSLANLVGLSHSFQEGRGNPLCWVFFEYSFIHVTAMK